jgi:hypothetical protein
MHSCLSCNQSCSISSVFCDACRLALLERGTEEARAGLVGVGGRERLVESASLSQGETSEQSSQLEVTGEATVRQTEEECFWSWNGASSSRMEADGEGSIPINAPLVLDIPPFVRRRIPKRVRVALLIFLLAGALALTIDGSLLVWSLVRHHTQSQNASSDGPGFGSQQLFLTPVGQLPRTPATTNGVADKAFSLSPSRLFFTVTQGQADPASQTVILSSAEQSSFSWQVISTLPSWLHLSSLQGEAVAGAKTELLASVQATQLAPNTYTAHLQIKAMDSRGQPLGRGLQSLTVVLSLLMPCSLSASPTTMSFSSDPLQPVPPPQELSLSESGNCARPVNWSISSSATWVSVSSRSGRDTGSGSVITVQATSSDKLVGTSKAYLTLQATDGHALPLSGSPITITVTLTTIV